MDLREPAANQKTPQHNAGASAPSKRVLAVVLWSCLAAAVCLWVCLHSIHVSAVRIYRADECRNVCAAWFLGTGQGIASGTPVSLFYLPLMWLFRGVAHSVDLYVSARFFCTILLWLNVVLLTAASGQKIFSRGGVVALVGAATLVPLWDFGFEIRPDNLILAGLLLMWCVLRVRPEGLQSYFIAGALAMALQFVDVQTLLYSLPISLAACAFPQSGKKISRWKAPVIWLIGAAIAALIVRIVYGAAGLWEVYVHNWLNSFARVEEEASGRWPFVVHLVFQTPLLLALAVGALVALAIDLRSRGRTALSWDGELPEGLLFVLAFLVYVLNPTPPPYQFLYLVAFAFPLAARFVSSLWNKIPARDVALPQICGLLLFGHFVPFILVIQRSLSMTNFRQEGLMQLAEQMTAPGKDFVYDEAGLVPTRRSAQYQIPMADWNTPAANQFRSLRDLFAAQPPSVIVVGSGFDELSKDDYDFIRGHYVPIADDIWTLGKILPAGGGAFEIIHPGRYQITSAEASNIRGTFPAPKNLIESMTPAPKFPPLTGTLNGAPFDGKPVQLELGSHQFACVSGTRPAVAWLGPQLDRIERLSPADRHDLFVKWH